MRIPDHVLEEIKTRLPLSAVVARRVTWDKRRSQPQRGDYWACCPFHQERSPSFHVDDRRGFYHCFGCGASGDHVRFVMETEGASFGEAVERLASEAGVPLPAPDAATERRERRRKGLSEIAEAAAEYFQARFAGPDGRAAREYAERRRLGAETVKTFRIGFAPAERDGLKRHLAARGVEEAMLEEVGLLIRPEDGRPSYDRFRNRLIIPIHDTAGRVVAFGGRAMGADQQPKYLNSPETPLFQKRSLLFNAHRARDAARSSGSVVVVEGYLDAIACWQAGIRSVVATLGTAFTEDQIASLWRLAPEPVLCFDGDRAGIEAANRAIDRILPMVEAGRSFNFAFLPQGLDPDDLIAERGADGFLSEVRNAVPLVDAVFTREAASARLDTPERRAAFEKRLDAAVEQIRDRNVQRGYRATLRIKLSELYQRLRPGQRPPRGGRGGPPPPVFEALATAPPLPAEAQSVERLALALLLEHPDLVARHAERVAALPLGSEVSRRFRDALAHLVADATDRLDGEDGLLDERFLRELGEIRGDGGRIKETVRLLSYHPSSDFLERYVLVLFERLEIAALEAEILERTRRIGDALSEADWEALKGLNEEAADRRAALGEAERVLDEEARAIRAAYLANGDREGIGAPGPAVPALPGGGNR